MHVVSSVHYGMNFSNVLWESEKKQMIFGDGGNVTYNFTESVEVIGHEFTHGVTQHTSGLVFHNQSGALNEHVSDVFGIMVKQRLEDEKAADADWLLGEGCLFPGIKGVSIRSMKAPGTAYDDPELPFGKDPQPDNFNDYKHMRDVMECDFGGVHVNSGIPNFAFYKASVAFGGYSWQKAGKIWWESLRNGRVPKDCTFLQFADITVDVAGELFGEDAAKIVRKAWNDVGVGSAKPSEPRP